MHMHDIVSFYNWYRISEEADICW